MSNVPFRETGTFRGISRQGGEIRWGTERRTDKPARKGSNDLCGMVPALQAQLPRLLALRPARDRGHMVVGRPGDGVIFVGKGNAPVEDDHWPRSHPIAKPSP